MPDARRTHGLACKNKKAHEQSHHRDAEARRHSLRDGFNNLFHALPGDRAFCHRHRRDAKHRRQQRVRNAQDSAGDLGARSTATDWHDGQIKVRLANRVKCRANARTFQSIQAMRQHRARTVVSPSTQGALPMRSDTRPGHTPCSPRKRTAGLRVSGKIARSVFAPVTALRPDACASSVARSVTRPYAAVGLASAPLSITSPFSS